MAMFDRMSPEIAILDIGLPDMDGYGLAQKLRARGRAYLIALTGYGLESDRARASSAGFDRHLIKPVMPEVCFAPWPRHR